MSVRLEESTEIHRPADEVFAYISNVDNFPTWAGPVVEVRRTSSEPLVAGQTFTLVQKFLGRRFETPCEVTEVEPSRRFAFRSTGGPFPLSFTYTCEPSAAGTRFTEVGEASQVVSSSSSGRCSRRPPAVSLGMTPKRSRNC